MSLRLAEKLSREEMEKSKDTATTGATATTEPVKKGKGKARNTKSTAKSGASNKGKRNKKQNDEDDDGNESSSSSSSSGSSGSSGSGSSSSSSGSSGSSSSGSSVSDDDSSGSSSSGSGSSSDDSGSSSDEDDAGQGSGKKKGASKRKGATAKGNSKANESTRSSKRQKISEAPQSKTPPVPTPSIEEPEDPGYGSDLYYNSEDERILNEKDEVERETIMAERFEKRRVWKETMAMLGKTKKIISDKSATVAASTTKTARGNVASKAKGRKGKNDMEESEEEEESSASESNDDDEEDYDDSPRKKSTQTRSSSGTKGKGNDDKDSDIIESDDEDNDDDDDRGKNKDKRQKKSITDSPPCTLADIQRVQIRRADILKWLDEPYLRDIIGCYVNYLKGTGENGQPEYWLCEILDVISTEHFSVVDGERVNILLKLRLGNQSKEYGVDRVSNKIVDENGFARWLNLLERSRVSPPTVAEAEETYKRIKDNIFNHTYTNEEIIEKIQRRRQRKDIGTKVLAREREEIAEQLLAAQEINDEEQIKICERKLRDIDLRMKLKYKNYNFMVNEINKKNKLKNMTKKAPVLTSSSNAMDSILARPHLRRPTRPMQLWNSSKNPTPASKPSATSTAASSSTAKPTDNGTDQKKDQAQLTTDSTDTTSKMNIEYGDDDNMAFDEFGSSKNGNVYGVTSIGTSQSNQANGSNAKKGKGMSLLEYRRKKEAGEL